MTPSPEEWAREIFKVFAIQAFSGSERAYDVEKFNKLMDEAVQRTVLALKAYGDERVEEVIGVVESEPEMPDQMPDEMWNAIRNDRDACGESHRIAVRITKRNIVNNLRTLKSQP